jgi:AhpD family alkylhydroperoxidase
MEARMRNPAVIVPEAMQAITALNGAIGHTGVPEETLRLVHLRASQINACSACVYSGTRAAQKAGDPEERLFAVAAWRDAPFFDGAERAALALAEALTRLSDRVEAVPDDAWEEAARHYDERALAGLVLSIATTNLFNRLNVSTKQPAGVWG